MNFEQNFVDYRRYGYKYGEELAEKNVENKRHLDRLENFIYIHIYVDGWMDVRIYVCMYMDDCAKYNFICKISYKEKAQRPN